MANPIVGRGALIVVEGLDRVGKTTKIMRLVASLTDKGIPVKMVRFPDRTTAIGAVIDKYLQGITELDDHTVHLLFSSNRWEKLSAMKKDLEEGTTLVVDRYAFSGVAYSSAKQGMDFNWCKNSDKGLISPDLVAFISVMNEQICDRGGFGDERYENITFQQKVAASYQKLKDPTWIELAGDFNESDKTDAILFKSALETIQKVATCPLGYLWT